MASAGRRGPVQGIRIFLKWNERNKRNISMLVDDFCQYHAQDDTLGGRISLAREKAMQTIEEAADQLGVTPQIWMDWECDSRNPITCRL
jgi:hypothetical protein